MPPTGQLSPGQGHHLILGGSHILLIYIAFYLQRLLGTKLVMKARDEATPSLLTAPQGLVKDQIGNAATQGEGRFRAPGRAAFVFFGPTARNGTSGRRDCERALRGRPTQMTTRDDATMKRRGLSRRAFLKATAGTAGLTGALPAERLFAPSIARAALKIEKEDLKLGFIKLTDMAPIAIAKELNFFEDEGLFVSTEPQANWKVLLDRVITGELDGAHMLAGQPLGATIGFGTKAHVITPFSMDLNGNGITVSNAVWDEMKKHIPKGADGKPIHPIKADALKKVVDK